MAASGGAVHDSCEGNQTRLLAAALGWHIAETLGPVSRWSAVAETVDGRLVEVSPPDHELADLRRMHRRVSDGLR